MTTLHDIVSQVATANKAATVILRTVGPVSLGSLACLVRHETGCPKKVALESARLALR